MKTIRRTLGLLAVFSATTTTAAFAARGGGGFGSFTSTTNLEAVADSGSVTTIACITGKISFDGLCLDSTNIAATLDLSTDEVVSHHACQDEDGNEIDDCVVVLVDEGSYPEAYPEYVVTAEACSGGLFSSEICVGDYTAVARSLHAVETWEYGTELEVIDVITNQEVGTQRGSPVWEDVGMTVVEQEVYAAGSGNLDYTITVRNETMDGVLVDEDTLYGGVYATSTGTGQTPADRCKGQKDTRDATGEMLGDAFTFACDLLHPVSSVSVEGFGASRNLDVCDSGGQSLKSIQKWYAQRQYNACLNNPGAFFSDLDPLTSELDELGVLTVIPKSSVAGDCDSLDGTVVKTQYERSTDSGGTETCTVEAELDCEDSGEDCSCTGTPTGDPVCE